MEAIRSSETFVLIRSKRRHVPEDGILQNYGVFALVHDRLFQTQKPTPWPLARKRTIPTERPPFQTQGSGNRVFSFSDEGWVVTTLLGPSENM
jgi:hypothetical protein